MVPGFNTDFKYRGETYHVQTEDNGVGNPVVVTLLYHKGAILASRRTPYQELLGKPGFEQDLMALMKSQHKELMRNLLAGAYDKSGAAPAIAGVSVERPADPAATVARAPSKPLPAPVPSPSATFRAAPAAAVVSRPSTAPRTATLTLDEAVRHYLEEFAATAAGAH